MKDKLNDLYEKFVAVLIRHFHLKKNAVFKLYWDLSLEQRHKVRLAAFAFAILVAGIIIGRVTIVNRVVKIEKSEKGVKVEKTGAMSITLPGIKLNPEIYIFQEAKISNVPVEIKVPGRLAFNAEKSKVLAARAPGRVERIFAFEGATVDMGSPAIELYSPEYLSAQQEFLLSAKTASILASNKSTNDLLADAVMTQQAAANRMRNLGSSDADIGILEKSGKPQNSLLMRSPIKGVVTKRAVEPGAIINAGDVLLTLADPKALWFLGNVFEQDIRSIAKGQTLTLRTEAYPDKEFIAKANYIAPAIDPVTRALLIRCDVENSEGLLRSDMYVSAKLKTGSADAIVVPQSAIIRVREQRFLIIKEGQESYRRLEIGGYDLDGKQFAITEGVKAGAQILIEGAVLLNDRFARQED